MGSEGRRIDQWVPADVVPGEPIDLGWATAVLNLDGTMTRTCKDCKVSVTSPTHREGIVLVVERRPLVHGDGCHVWARLGNNPGLS